MDLQPILMIKLVRALTLVLGWNFLWKHPKQDAVYTPPAPLAAICETIGTSRYIGDQVKLEGIIISTDNGKCALLLSIFEQGNGLNQISSKDVAFLMTSLAS